MFEVFEHETKYFFCRRANDVGHTSNVVYAQLHRQADEQKPIGRARSFSRKRVYGATVFGGRIQGAAESLHM